VAASIRMGRPFYSRVTLAVLIVAVLVLSVTIWRKQRAMEESERAATDTMAALRRTNATLEAELVERKRQDDASPRDQFAGATRKTSSSPTQTDATAFNGPLGDLKFIAASKARGFGGLRSFSSFGPAMMTAQFVRTYALSPAEVSFLKERMNDASRRIDALSLSNASAARDAAGNFVITVKPTADGAGVHDELLEAFRTTLGEERYRYFRELSADEFGVMLGYFGAQERTITIKPHPTGPERFMFEDQSKSVTRDRGGFGRSGPVADRQKLVEMYPLFESLVPADL
jgi:hypothetical protein